MVTLSPTHSSVPGNTVSNTPPTGNIGNTASNTPPTIGNTGNTITQASTYSEGAHLLTELLGGTSTAPCTDIGLSGELIVHSFLMLENSCIEEDKEDFCHFISFV